MITNSSTMSLISNVLSSCNINCVTSSRITRRAAFFLEIDKLDLNVFIHLSFSAGKDRCEAAYNFNVCMYNSNPVVRKTSSTL